MKRRAWFDRLLPRVLFAQRRPPLPNCTAPPHHDEIEIVQGILQRSGLSPATREAALYIVQEHALRKQARDIWKTPEFLAILNVEGRLLPRAEAWHLTVKPAFSALATIRDLSRKAEAGVPMVRFRFGHMLAGHCPYSAEMENKRIPLQQAIPLPPPQCTHPDQCGCRWQAWLSIMDELGGFD